MYIYVSKINIFLMCSECLLWVCAFKELKILPLTQPSPLSLKISRKLQPAIIYYWKLKILPSFTVKWTIWNCTAPSSEHWQCWDHESWTLNLECDFCGWKGELKTKKEPFRTWVHKRQSLWQGCSQPLWLHWWHCRKKSGDMNCTAVF